MDGAYQAENTDETRMDAAPRQAGGKTEFPFHVAWSSVHDHVPQGLLVPWPPHDPWQQLGVWEARHPWDQREEVEDHLVWEVLEKTSRMGARQRPHRQLA
jgi:hypothetical protein